ncbi:hypothetical protein H1230_16130 [Paenibacillus sp. 19GGS1-52]|uniref:hypothetical protein n=1 Tax=Paenibacillus sp. 19GGS1-52 TaxID=2758563 RepID=UPI001EFB4440|nr:hypothetical protein [Paenibacillus sp. 19GGS1-52]ULO04698.1 hypothetical protein H1230_16130 [Paenibacillus sp. 19GGS1-52]
MKKKWLMTGGAVGISGVIMLATGLTAFAGTSGYDDYKAALKNTQGLESVTAQVSAVLKDNGSLLSQAQGSLKANLQDEAVSGTVKISGTKGTESLSLYNQADGEVLKSDASDIYYVLPDKSEQKDKSKNKDATWINNEAETVIDALVGNLQNEVTSTTASDGSKHISLQLESAQIPAVVQALVPIVFKHASAVEDRQTEDKGVTKENDPQALFHQSLFDFKDLSLTEGVQIQSVSLNADINAANELESQQLIVTITGKDASGTTHTLTSNLDVQLSGFNGTTPDSIDLTGKQVKQLSMHHGDRFHE